MKHIRLGTVFAAATAIGLSLAPLSADAVPIQFTGTSGSLAASATFDVVGTNIQVVLTNTSTADVLAPGDVLTGMYFSGVGALSPISAVLSPGSSVFYDPDGQPAGGVVGGEWGFGSGLSAPGGATAAITSTGALNGVGQPNFTGPNLAGPTALDGVQYGLLSAGDNTATGNGGITGSEGLIKNSVTFSLSGLPAGFSLSNISNVLFQYGTSLSETIIPGNGSCPNGATNFPTCSNQVPTPEPMSMALLATGLAALGFVRRRRA